MTGWKRWRSVAANYVAVGWLGVGVVLMADPASRMRGYQAHILGVCWLILSAVWERR